MAFRKARDLLLLVQKLDDNRAGLFDVGFFDEEGPVSRAEVVVDATSKPARQVYYKDLRLLGRGFAIDALRGTTAGVPEPLEAPKPLEAAEWE